MTFAPPAFMVPFSRDDKFVGREDVLRRIEEGLKGGHRVSLAGIGGIGYESFHSAAYYNL